MDIIAEREFKFVGAELSGKVMVRLGKPEPDGKDWRVFYEIHGPDGRVRKSKAIGVDSMQALTLALQLLPAELSFFMKRGRLTWNGSEDTGFGEMPAWART